MAGVGGGVGRGADPNLDRVRNTGLFGTEGSPGREYVETEEKGSYAVGDLAFYPDRLMGGVRRQTHWENAREQGLVAGANMTGKKRIRYEQIPYLWTERFDLKFDFVGDFSLQPTRVDLKGTPAKTTSVGRYYQGDSMRAIPRWGTPPQRVKGARTDLRKSMGA